MSIHDNGEHVVKERFSENVIVDESVPSEREVTIPPRPKPPYQLAGYWGNQCAYGTCGFQRVNIDDRDGFCELHAWETTYGHLVDDEDE